ncbi:signal peptidase I [Neisseria montereyensis]|nr:signal peptidase I [Neisseria montereyensis]
MTNNLLYAAIAAFIIGLLMFAKSNKEREETGEWSNSLQWGYLLMMVGVFGVLSAFMSFTAVLLIFVLFTGVVWFIHKSRLKKQAGQARANHFFDYMSGFFPIILLVFVLRTFVAEPFQIPSSSMRPGLIVGDFILVNKFAYGIRTPIINNVLIPTGKVERGDVIVFNYPEDTKINYIKRVVGLPGDTVEYKDKVLTVNGVEEKDIPDGMYRYPEDQNPEIIREAQYYQSNLDNREFAVLKMEGYPSVDIGSLNFVQHRMEEEGIDSGLAENCRYAEDGSGFVCKVPEGSYFALGDNRDGSSDSRYWGFINDKLVVGKAFLIWMNFNDMSRIGQTIH